MSTVVQNFWTSYWHLSFEIIAVFFLWLLLYKASARYFVGKSKEWNNRIVTLVHGLLIALLSAYSILVVGPLPTNYASTLHSTLLHNRILAISLSYFIFDTCWCLYYKTEGPVMMCHHITTVITIITIIYLQESVVSSVSALGLGEVTNPFLQVRWFLKELKINSTIFSMIVDASFMILFFVCRFIFSSVITYYVLVDPVVSIFMKSLTLILTLVSVIFMFQIINAAKKTWRRLKKSS